MDYIDNMDYSAQPVFRPLLLEFLRASRRRLRQWLVRFRNWLKRSIRDFLIDTFTIFVSLVVLLFVWWLCFMH